MIASDEALNDCFAEAREKKNNSDKNRYKAHRTESRRIHIGCHDGSKEDIDHCMQVMQLAVTIKAWLAMGDGYRCHVSSIRYMQTLKDGLLVGPFISEFCSMVY